MQHAIFDHVPHLSIGCARATDESGLIPEAPCVHAHFQAVKLRVEQYKRIRPADKTTL